jgi:AcrR family transcriptional regulator
MAAALFPENAPEDGRRARRYRSRDLAVDAFLDLLSEGVVRPTAQLVAERSGVSLRSIFRIFDDVSTLHSAAAARQLARVRPLFVDVPDTGSLEDRVATMVEIHARLYESVAPIRRAALRAAPESPPLQEQLAKLRAWHRAEVERVFAPELTSLDDAVVDALELVMTFEAWDQLRAAQGRSVEAARAAIERAALALLRQAE